MNTDAKEIAEFVYNAANDSVSDCADEDFKRIAVLTAKAFSAHLRHDTTEDEVELIEEIVVELIELDADYEL